MTRLITRSLLSLVRLSNFFIEESSKLSVNFSDVWLLGFCSLRVTSSLQKLVFANLDGAGEA